MTNEAQACSVCEADLKVERITYTQTIGRQVYIVTDVPAQVCHQCGAQYLSPEVVDAIQELIEARRAPQETIEVPVYHVSQAVA
jgi:YgiT-type zinc finger domain-containing protein